jgi:hypothetical protein
MTIAIALAIWAIVCTLFCRLTAIAGESDERKGWK